MISDRFMNLSAETYKILVLVADHKDAPAQTLANFPEFMDNRKELARRGLIALVEAEELLGVDILSYKVTLSGYEYIVNYLESVEETKEIAEENKFRNQVRRASLKTIAELVKYVIAVCAGAAAWELLRRYFGW